MGSNPGWDRVRITEKGSKGRIEKGKIKVEGRKVRRGTKKKKGKIEGWKRLKERRGVRGREGGREEGRKGRRK